MGTQATLGLPPCRVGLAVAQAGSRCTEDWKPGSELVTQNRFPPDPKGQGGSLEEGGEE